ncbi:GSCOCG00002969001-RA-CDS [Cotesia congregata]|nr:GSCOCG00002969001-RA-CDS [Cotesia congregata]
MIIMLSYDNLTTRELMEIFQLKLHHDVLCTTASADHGEKIVVIISALLNATVELTKEDY